MPTKKTTDKKTIQANSKTLADRPKDTATKMFNGKKFPIVGLGASAGGLQALKAFFSNVPENSGMA